MSNSPASFLDEDQSSHSEKTPEKWFLLKSEEVLGPFTTQQIETEYLQIENILIWGKGFNEWVEVSKWKNKYHQITHKDLEAKTDQAIWKIRIEGQETSLMKFDEMVDYLKSIKDLNYIEIWLDSQKRWKDLFTINRIVDALGVSRRSHPRVPILGILHCESSTKGVFDVKVITISEGGMGVVEGHQLRIGDRFKGTLDSPNLFAKVASNCEVLYRGKEGYAGLKFVSLSQEYKTQVIEYINKFNND